MATTPNLNLEIPDVGADADMWGNILNADLGILDIKVLDQTLLAAGVVTFLRTPSSINLRAVVTDETGAGPLVFGTSPTIATPTITGDALINGLTVGRGAGNNGSNTAVGNQALAANTTGGENTAVGRIALQQNTTGSGNSALGTNALSANTTGQQNAAFGRSALTSNTTGSDNAAFGSSSMSSNTTGVLNSAFGTNTLLSVTTGNLNNGFGHQALVNTTTGGDNCAVGVNCLSTNTTGNANSAIGRDALGAVTTGSANFGVGNASGTDAVRTITTQSNEGVLGNNSTVAIYAKVGITVTSDIRDKTEIRDVPHGLDLVKAITPISYRFKTSRDDATPKGRVHYGFSAQDILALQADQAVVDSSDPENLKLNAQDLIPVLWNAVRSLTEQVESLQSEIQTLKGNSSAV